MLSRYTIILLACVAGCASRRTPSVVSSLVAGSGRACRQGDAATAVDTTFDSSTNAPSTFYPIGPPHLQYPRQLRSQGVQGSVVAGYSVDTLGHVIPGSERIVAEAHPEFGDAVCEMLKDLRFNPLVLNGRKYSVRVLEQPFTFSLIR